MTDHDAFMRRAITLSARALDEPGVYPYGAVVVKDGAIVGEGINRARVLFDPTSHAETEAIRAAGAALGTHDLAGCTIYTSSEPCSMCSSAIVLANIDAVYYAASIADNARTVGTLLGTENAPPSGLALRAEVAKPIEQRRIPAARLLVDEANTILADFTVARRSK